MIQDIEPHRLFNEYRPFAKPSLLSPVFYFENGCPLVRSDGKNIYLPSLEDIGISTNDTLITYLFALDDTEYFIYRGHNAEIPQGFTFEPARKFRHELAPADKYMSFVIATAIHLSDWYTKTRFCGRCGASMGHSSLERAMVCPDCRNTVYPRIMPAVIVGIKNKDKLLVTKYANRPFTEYALVAGFTEIGETLEQTVKREVKEETGLNVKNITYYKSQPWGAADDILAGFFCDVDGSDEIIMDEKELKIAKWVTREEIELQSNDFSLTNEMMTLFKNNEIPSD